MIGVWIDRAVFVLIALFGLLALCAPHWAWVVLTGWHYMPEDRKGHPGEWTRLAYRLVGAAMLFVALWAMRTVLR